jgi:hypothetical protein
MGKGFRRALQDSVELLGTFVLPEGRLQRIFPINTSSIVSLQSLGKQQPWKHKHKHC